MKRSEALKRLTPAMSETDRKAAFFHRDPFLAVQYVKHAQMMGREKAVQIVWNSYVLHDSVMMAAWKKFDETAAG